jgi:hypothetical protein
METRNEDNMSNRCTIVIHQTPFSLNSHNTNYVCMLFAYGLTRALSGRLRSPM